MEKIQGLQESFQKGKVIILTTFGEDGDKHVRQMTNLNDDPYSMMWFTSYTRSRKVEDVKKNPQVIISFPSESRDELFEIEGKAQLERQEVVDQKWSWWYLYWRPEQENKFWFPKGESHPEWSIINIYPTSARRAKKSLQNNP
jgi:general stress protein 26